MDGKLRSKNLIGSSAITLSKCGKGTIVLISPHPESTHDIGGYRKQVGKEFKESKFKAVERKMEKLRIANEKLRDSGIYWHDACKEAVRDLLGKKKTR